MKYPQILNTTLF